MMPSIQLQDGWGNTPSSQFNQAYTIYHENNGLQSTTGWWGNTPVIAIQQKHMTIYMVNGLQSTTGWWGPSVAIPYQAYTIVHPSMGPSSSNRQDGTGATPHGIDKFRPSILPSTWKNMALNSTTGWCTQHFALYIVIFLLPSNEIPFTTGQWPSIQLQDGGATPHHRNSTKHIPFTWSMAFQFNYRMVGQHPIIAIQPSIYHLHGQWPSNSITGWWGNTPSSQFNQAYTIYMVNGPQFNYRMVGQHPIIAIQTSIYHLHGQWHPNSTT